MTDAVGLQDLRRSRSPARGLGPRSSSRSSSSGHQGSGGLVRLCCFHPGYGYEDFIEGYRPDTTAGGQITFTLRDGLFQRLCKEAAQAPERNFYLIVDEINRGDVPRIFGELLTVLEKDKRGKAVALPVSGAFMQVPTNVYLIGTMNTADRSISLLDAALRRRFGFVELMPDAKVLGQHAIEGIPLGPWLNELNRRIRQHVGRDACNLQVGHAYLLPDGHPPKGVAAFARIIRDDLVPLIEEYCYEDFKALRNILGDGLFDGDSQRLRLELFDDDQDITLVEALKFSEISTSSAVPAPIKDDIDHDGGVEGEAED